MRNLFRGFLAIITLLPGSAHAQQAAMWRDSAAYLKVAMQAAYDSSHKGDSSSVEVARRGNLVLYATAALRHDAIDALDRFMAARDRRFHDALPTDAGFRISLKVQTDERNSTTRPQIRSDGAIVLAGLPDSAGAVHAERVVWAPAVPDALIDRYGEMMIASVTPLAKWIEDPPPMSMDETRRRELAMYDFAIGTGPMQRACVRGDLRECRYALDIEHAPPTETGAIFPKFTHADFLYFTLDVGGEGAWQRFRAAGHDSLSLGLAAAAKVPLDSLIARWRDGILKLRPASTATSPSSAIAAVAWITLLLLGALGVARWV